MTAAPRFANLIFDFDGTLVDSLPGIESSLRAAVAGRSQPLAVTQTALREKIGPPLSAMMAALWPELDPGEIPALVTAYRAHYLPAGCRLSEPFPGVGETLERFRAAGLRLFLLTNKPTAPTRAILERLGWRDWFTEVLCPDHPDHPFTEKTRGACKLCERHGLDRTRTLLTGDSKDDRDAADAAGFAFAAAGYGYGGAAGHGTGFRGEVLANLGAFVELAPLVFGPLILPPLPPRHDHP